MGVALDSTLFVDLARRRPAALRKIEELDSRRELKVIPTPVAYEGTVWDPSNEIPDSGCAFPWMDFQVSRR